MNNIIDPKVMTEFEANLGVFNKAMASANTEIDSLLAQPGIESHLISAELHLLKTKLGELSTKWDELAKKFKSNLNISIQEAEELQKKIQDTLETN